MLDWRELTRLPDDELAQLDIAAVNLAVAVGLPGWEQIDFDRCLRTLDRWANHVRKYTTGMMPRFRRASAASRFLPCARRIEAYTVWPARNRVSAVSRPKPLLAPVIRIVLDILGLLEV